MSKAKMRRILQGLVMTAVSASVSSFTPRASAQTASAPSAQTSPASDAESTSALPVYEVVSIRPSKNESDDRHSRGRLNTLEIRNTPLVALLQDAFNVPEKLIDGLPAWATHLRVDIDAKTLETDTARLRNVTRTQRRAMLLALLETRMGLKWHNETRVMPAYEILVANGGPKLKPTIVTGQNGGVSVNDTRLSMTNAAVSTLGIVLADKLGRPVVDKTGLTGRYDITLAWTSEQAAATGADAPPPLFTALQEQLGLKLKSGNDPVQVFVIDQIVQPSME